MSGCWGVWEISVDICEQAAHHSWRAGTLAFRCQARKVTGKQLSNNINDKCYEPTKPRQKIQTDKLWRTSVWSIYPNKLNINGRYHIWMGVWASNLHLIWTTVTAYSSRCVVELIKNSATLAVNRSRAGHSRSRGGHSRSRGGHSRTVWLKSSPEFQILMVQHAFLKHVTMPDHRSMGWQVPNSFSLQLVPQMWS